MGGLIVLSMLCLFLLIQNWHRDRRIKKMAVKIEDYLSGNGPMLDVALEEDDLARLQNAISDTQQALSRQRELYAQECARTSNLTADISHQLKTPLTTLRLYTELDGVTWYVDNHGDFRMDGYHHDGHNYYLYRRYRDDATPEAIEEFQGKILDHTLTEEDIDRVTVRLGDDIAKIYGFTLPDQAKTMKERNDAR